MALHDIDKNSEDRGSPTPNHSDVLSEGAVKAHKTISSHYSSDADTSAGQLQMGNKQIVANDGTTNKALFGYQQGLGLWGAFVAKPGIDVKTNTDLSQFIFNSSQNTFKIVQTGITGTPAITLANPGAGVYASAQASTIIAHNLGYIPAVLAYVDRGTSYELMPSNSASGAGSSARWYTIYPTVDATNLTITYEVTVLNQSFSQAANAFPIKYYLLQETAN